jgi:peroxiredoxin
MIKRMVFALLLAVPGVGIAQNSNYKISGRLIDVGFSKIYLLSTKGFMQQIDSAEVINGRYELKGSVQPGQRAMLMNYNFKTSKLQPEGLVMIFIAPGAIEVTHTKSFNTIAIRKSAANDQYKKLMEAAKPYQDKIGKYQSEVFRLQKGGDTISANDVYAKQFALEQDYKKEVLGDFVLNNPKSPVAFFALKEFVGNGHEIDGVALEKYFKLLAVEVRESEDGRLMHDRIENAITFATAGAIGSTVTGFTLQDTSGKDVNLSDYKGKYVLLDFWASWCTPCRADNPHLVAAYKQFHSKGFEILSVSLDLEARKSAWIAAINHDKLNAWKHVADLRNPVNTAAKRYGVTGIPQNFLISPDGKIIGRSLRGGDLEKTLANLLKN